VAHFASGISIAIAGFTGGLTPRAPRRVRQGRVRQGWVQLRRGPPGLLAGFAVACLVVGLGFLTVADAGWAHAVGVVALFGFIILGVLAVSPAETAAFYTNGARGLGD